METLDQTISDLEGNEVPSKGAEIISGTENFHKQGDNHEVEDACIFKSFFEKEDFRQKSDIQTISQLCYPDKICSLDVKERQKPQIGSDISTNCSDLLKSEKESLAPDTSESTDDNIENKLPSKQSQCIASSLIANNCKSETSTFDDTCDFVSGDKNSNQIKSEYPVSGLFDSVEKAVTEHVFDILCEEKSLNTGTQDLEQKRVGCTYHKVEDSLVNKSNSQCCEKENCDYDNNENNPSIETEEENILTNELCERKPMFKKLMNAGVSSYDSKKMDPFTLSGDEDFSPKAYKPIKRKLNQGLVDIKEQRMEKLDFHSNNQSSDEKRLKLLDEEDLSLPDMSACKPVNVAYVYSKELVDKVNKLIRIEGRAELVHSLIEVYGILQHVDVIPPRLATETEITGFHCSEYINFLKSLKDSEDMSESCSDEAEAYGLSYDCPVQEDVFETACLISGATISAAESLINGMASIAINWCGGWHHAKRDCASGFCYINDIVLGILKLREKFERVLYVDLDLHHGDGVEEAFYTTPKVMTVSFHKYGLGFFPGSGSVEDTGSGRGKLYSVNVPLMDGIADRQFYSVFTSVMKKIREKFNADAVVIQCGADSLSEDLMASFNLTHLAIAKCVCFLLTWSLPTLLLGGGGYNFPNTAKCWTFLTAMAAGKKLPIDIPEHEHLIEYGPSFELTTSQGNRKDCNTKEHFYDIMANILKNLNHL